MSTYSDGRFPRRMLLSIALSMMLLLAAMESLNAQPAEIRVLVLYTNDAKAKILSDSSFQNVSNTVAGARRRERGSDE